MDHFSQLYQGKDSIIIGNGSHLPILHIGNSYLSTRTKSFLLHNVLCIPSIHKNLICVHQFSYDNDCHVEFNAFGYCVKDNKTKRTLFFGNNSNGLYFIKSNSSQNHLAALVDERTHQDVWHAWFGHPSSYVMKFLFSKINCLYKVNFIHISFGSHVH